jgi:hypothetical protein
VRAPTDSRARTQTPYVDVELYFEPHRSQVPLVRSVAAETARTEGAGNRYIEKVRLVAGTLASAMVPLADRNAPACCLLRVLESEIRVRIAVHGVRSPTPEAKSEHARLLEELAVSATTFTTPDPAGGFDVVSDAYIPIDR